MESQLAHELDKFSEKQRKVIYKNVFALELTDGCSIGCDFCGLDSKIGVNSFIPFSVLEQIADEITRLTDRTTSRENSFSWALHPNRISLYNATDPLDYEDETKKYFDVFELFGSKGFVIYTSTAIPKGKEEIAVKNLEDIDRITISHMNRERLAPYFKSLGAVIYIDLFNYYRKKFGSAVHDKSPIKEGQIKVTDSVEKTIKQLRKQDKTLPRKTRFYDLRVDKNRLHKEVQSSDVLCLWCGEDRQYPRDGRIIDRDEDGLQNYGRAFNMPPFPLEHWQRESHFCGISGVKMTPEGIFNVLAVRLSDEHKTGRITEKITPENFRVLKLKREVSTIPEIVYCHCDYSLEKQAS